MRHFQGRGNDPYWSAAHSSQQLALNLSPSHLVHGVSPDVLVSVAGGVAVVVAVLGFLVSRGVWRGMARGRKRNREAVTVTEGHKARLFSGIGPQAVVAAGGVAVSIHGLWGFATGTAHLPAVLAVGFISTFDLAEMVLFGMLYRAADSRTGWTPELRLMHKTAWTLVGFSSAMNAVHAPNWWAKPVLASIPALAAWLIELQLRAKLQKSETDTSVRPGPVRLVLLSWQHMWSRLFAKLNLDANASNGQISRGALAQRAAHQAYQLRLALLPAKSLQAKVDAGQQLSRSDQKKFDQVQRDLGQLRRRAQSALDNSGMGVDTEQTLDVFRRLTTLIRVDDVALISGTPQETVGMAEELAVLPAARLIETSARALAVEEEMVRSVAAREEAERARLAAEEAMAAAEAEREEAVAARLEAEEIARQALEKAAESEAEAARSVAAREEAERARLRSVEEITGMSEKATELKASAAAEEKRLAEAAEKRRQQEQAGLTAAQQREELTADLESIRAELESLESARTEALDAKRTAAAEAAEAEASVRRLQRQTEELAAAAVQERELSESAADQRRDAEAQAQQAASVAAAAAVEAEAKQILVREAEAALARLREEVREQLQRVPNVPAGGPVFPGSAAKQAAWEEYLAAVTEGRSPATAGELTERHPVSESNARNWLLAFRSKRDEMIALGLPSGAERRAAVTEREASADGDQPSGSRARDRDGTEEAPASGRITSQRVGV